MTTYQVLDALGDPMRRQVLELLRSGPAAVGELAGQLPISRPAVSQHLRVLEASGLVAHDSIGTRNIYRVAPEGLAALRAWLDDFWFTALDSFAEHAKQDASRRHR